MRNSLFIIPASAALMAGLPVTTAEARIRCIDGTQVVNGSRISTPYCQDNYLAKVARTYGTRVSAKSIRNNPSVKREVCRLVGQDIRVHQACVGTGIDVRGRHR